MAREQQGDIAWSHILRQHVGKPKTEGFVRAFYGPLTAAASALDALGSDRTLDGAEGARLDLIGSIVGVARDVPVGLYLAYFGYAEQPAGRAYGVARYRADGEATAQSYTAPDEEYRAMIRAKIALNNGHGTAAEIVAAVRHVFKTDLVSVRDTGPGAFAIWVGIIPSPDDQREFLIRDLLPRAAGVRFTFNYFTPQFFGYAEQAGATGYEQAAYARASSDNINPI
jgi:hypothetical protein